MAVPSSGCSLVGSPEAYHFEGLRWGTATQLPRRSGHAQVIPAHRCAEIAEHLEALRELGPIPAAPCHLDFTPGNLLRDDHGSMRVIDFEHTRYDLAARDLVRLATRTWTERPDLEDAFHSTYGSLTDLDREIITHCRHLDDLTRNARRYGLSTPGSER